MNGLVNMFELDLSLRVPSTPSTMEVSSTVAATADGGNVVMEDDSTQGMALDSTSEIAPSLTATASEEDVMMNSLFQIDDAQISGKKRTLDEDEDADDETDRPPADCLGTPEEVKRMRLIIDGAFEDSGHDVAGACSGVDMQPCELPPRFAFPPSLSEALPVANGGGSSSSSAANAPIREDAWKHAGLLREYGGVKGYMAQFPSKGGKAKM